MIATPESYSNAVKINDLRSVCGSSLVKLVKVPFVYKPLLNYSEKGIKVTNGQSVKFCSTELRYSLKQNLDNPCNLSLLRKSVTLMLNKMLISEFPSKSFCSIMNMIFSFVDDVIFEILYEWKIQLGSEKGKVVFERWFGEFIAELEMDEVVINPDSTENDSFANISKHLTFILIYIISSLNLIKKDKTEILLYNLNKLYVLFEQLLVDGYNKKEDGCEHSEFCVPYIFCRSEIETNIFFSKINDLKYSSFKCQFGDIKQDKALDLVLKCRNNSNDIVAHEDYYLKFEFVKKRLDEFFQANEIESKSLFQ